jgi:hypothetical protein
MAAKAVTDLPRNDVKAALAWLAELGRDPTPDEGQVLVMLQDDPAELFASLDTTAKV